MLNNSEGSKFWVTVIANLGFPIVISGYLLIKITAVLDHISVALTKQATLLDMLSRSIETLLLK